MAGYQKMMAGFFAPNRIGHVAAALDDDERGKLARDLGTGMFAFAIVTGVKNGWLPADPYGLSARKAWLALFSSSTRTAT